METSSATNNTAQRKRPSTLGLSMVKNEQDVIEPFVRHNIRFLDHLIVLDNGSVDQTRKILGKLAQEFENLEVVDDEKFGYTQSEKMTALLRKYQVKYAADYVISLDADEFLDAPDCESLLAELGKIPSFGVGLVPWATFVLIPEIVDAQADDPLRAMVWRRRQESGPLPFWKGIVRIDGAMASDVIIEQGNHSAHLESGGPMPQIGLPGLRLMHFPIRSREQFVAKSVVGWMAYLAKNPHAAADSQGIHWQTNFERVIHEKPIDSQVLCDMSMMYGQLPRLINWNTDVVQETPRLHYERRYSSGKFLAALTLIALSWEQSLTAAGRRSGALHDEAHASAAGNAEETNTTEQEVERLIAGGKPQDALTLLDTAIAKNESSDLWNDWAAVQLSSGNINLAERGFRQALNLDGAARQPAVNLGVLLLAQGRLREGIPLLERHRSTLTVKEKETILELVERCRSALVSSDASSLAPQLLPLAENTQRGEQNLVEKYTKDAEGIYQVCAKASGAAAAAAAPAKEAAPAPSPKQDQTTLFISQDHFRYIPDREAAKTLFKASVRFIEIEIHSYCNRNCTFCGNSFIDRRSNKTLLDPRIYSNIMDDLASLKYSGVIWYSRYNEPTSDRPLFISRLREAREKLPAARLQTFTNGDYMTPEYITALRDAGLNDLMIMCYLDKNDPPTLGRFIEVMVSRLNKLGLPWKFGGVNCAEVDVPGIRVTYNFKNFLLEGTNRGGSLSSGCVVDRISPCTVPITDVYVDYNGCMVPCCDVRSDYEPHRKCVVYQLTPENSIIEGYANSKLVLWRRDVTRFGPKEFPCNSCSRRLYEDNPATQALFRKVASFIPAVP